MPVIHGYDVHYTGGVVDPNDVRLDALERHENSERNCTRDAARASRGRHSPGDRFRTLRLRKSVGIPGGGFLEITLQRMLGAHVRCSFFPGYAGTRSGPEVSSDRIGLPLMGVRR